MGLGPQPPPLLSRRASRRQFGCVHARLLLFVWILLQATHHTRRSKESWRFVWCAGPGGSGEGGARGGEGREPGQGGPGGARLTPKRLRPGSESLGAPHRPRDIKGCAQHACGPIHGGRAHSHWRGHGNARPKHAGHHRHSGSPRPECTGNGHGGEEASRRVHSGASGVHDTSSPPICMSGRNSPGGGPGVLEVPLAVEVG